MVSNQTAPYPYTSVPLSDSCAPTSQLHPHYLNIARGTSQVTKSMHIAYEDLKLDRLVLIYPGNQTFPLVGKNMLACGLESIATGSLFPVLGL